MIVKELKFRIGFTAIILLFTLFPLGAQDTLTVSLSKALEIAMSESPTIKVANKEIERVNYSIKEKFAAAFPQINASGTYQRSLKKQRMFLPFSFVPGQEPDPNGIEVGVDNNINFGLGASLPLISPTLWAALEMTELDTKLVLESARSSKISLINQVTKAYYTILLTQDQNSVFRRSLQNATENARIIQNKYKQGTVSEYEWIRADVQVRNANSNLVSSESAVNLSKLQLKMIMGLDMNVGIKIDGSLSAYEDKMYGDVLLIDTTSLKMNTDLNQFDIKSSQLDHALKMQKAAWWPTLAASFNFAYTTMGNDGKMSSVFPTSNAGVQLSIPLFQGGARIYKEKQLKIQQSELKDQRDNLRRSLEMQAITYLDNIKKALEKIESNKEGLRQAEKAVSISKKMYEVGSSTYLDLSNSELSLIQAGLMYNQSIFDYLSAKADLEKLLSKNIK